MTMCATCVGRTVQEELASKGIRPAFYCPIPGCNAEITPDDLRVVCTRPVFDDWNEKSCKAWLNSDPSFLRCTNTRNGCGAGQLVVDGEENNVVTCYSCGWKTCFVHAEQMHLGVTCAQYDLWVDATSNAAMANNADATNATQRLLSSRARACPGCESPVIKVGTIDEDSEAEACAHMTCSSCDAEWCWDCQSFFVGGDPTLRRTPVRVCSTPSCTRTFLHCHHHPTCVNA